MLVEVGERLGRAIPEAPAYRHAGDGFTVLVEACRTDREARSAAEQVRRAAAVEVPESHGGMVITASVGAARARHGQAELAFEEADKAMYQAKERGKNQVVLA